jgi:hypothetical protein
LAYSDLLSFLLFPLQRLVQNVGNPLDPSSVERTVPMRVSHQQQTEVSMAVAVQQVWALRLVLVQQVVGAVVVCQILCVV